MANPEGEKPKRKRTPKKPPPSSGGASEAAEPNENPDPRNKPEGQRNQKQRRSIKERWEELCNASTDRLVELFLAFAILISAVVQVWMNGSNNDETSRQTSQLISAAKVSAYAAQQNVVAAQSFSFSADRINKGIGEAVNKLQVQADRMEESRIATETESSQALNSTIDNFHRDQRAWLGVGNPSFIIKKTDPLKAETHVIVLGKSPAIGIATRMGFIPFPAEHVLRVEDLSLNSGEIINGTGFPGSSFPVREKASDPISDLEKMLVDQIVEKKTILYFFGEVTYRDVFKVKHWTHFCYAITSDSTDDTNPCRIYNDSDDDEQHTNLN